MRERLLRWRGANSFGRVDETFMFEVHISTEVKIYSNWRLETFISGDDHDDVMLNRNDNENASFVSARIVPHRQPESKKCRADDNDQDVKSLHRLMFRF